MALKKYNPITPSRRYYTVSDFSEITKKTPEKGLLAKKSGSGGRNNYGRVTNINKGGGHKRRYRLVDFKRQRVGIPAKVSAIEYDPNRSARIALITYVDGVKSYILAPIGLNVGDQIVSGPDAEIRPGNALPLMNIPTGQPLHNVELKKGFGGQIARSAGVTAELVAKEGNYVLLKLPSGEMRKVHASCYASIGMVNNPEHQNVEIGKAGRSRWLNRRPHNRGVTKNPVDHPMGGGEGKSAGGRHPVSPTGVAAKGLKTRSNKRTDRFIVRRRKNKKKS